MSVAFQDEPRRLLPDLPALRELQALPRWVGLNRAKVPIDCKTGRFASVANPATWSPFNLAEAFALDHGLGLGFVLTADDELVGVDLDGVLDENGTPERWVAELLELGESYAEQSPSGRGVRMFARGSIPKAVKCNAASVEIYANARCLSITGKHLAASPTAIQPAPKTLAALHARVDSFKKPKQDSKPTGGDGFFRRLNQLALDEIDSWFPVLFPSARFQPGTHGWRVSPEDIPGRQDLEEAISATSDGIVDFGIADMGDSRDGKRTAVDVVMEHGNAADAVQAAFWLCRQLGRTPESLGWKGPGPTGKANGAYAAGPVDLLGAPELTGYPELTTDCLPSALYRYVTGEAERLNVDACAIAVHALAACCASISDEWSIRPKLHDSRWREQARIWSCVVKPVGGRGTEMIRTAFFPVKERDNALYRRWQAEYAAWESRQPEKKTKKNEREDPEPYCSRLITEDATIEAMSDILNRGGQYAKIALKCDELVCFFGSFNRYTTSGSAARALMLEAYDGGPRRIDRIKRGNQYVPNWSIVVAGNIQPRRLAGMAKDLADDGLFQRFTVIHAKPSPLGVIDDRPLSISAADEYRRLHDGLASLKPAANDDGPFPAWVDEDGRVERQSFMELVERLQADETQPTIVRETASKWSGLLARLSLVFHLVDVATRVADGEEISGRALQNVSGETVAMAATFLQRIALPNLLRLGHETFAEDGSAGAHARWIAGHILARRIEVITARDIGRAYRALRGKPAEIGQAMNILVHGAWASPQVEGARHDSMAWTINSAVHRIYAPAGAAERQRRAAVMEAIRKPIQDS